MLFSKKATVSSSFFIGIKKLNDTMFISRYSCTISMALITTSLKQVIKLPSSANFMACLIASVSFGIIS
jgi:hypothetical protein